MKAVIIILAVSFAAMLAAWVYYAKISESGKCFDFPDWATKYVGRYLWTEYKGNGQYGHGQTESYSRTEDGRPCYTRYGITIGLKRSPWGELYQRQQIINKTTK